MHLSEITLLCISVHVQGYIKEVGAFVPLYLEKIWFFTWKPFISVLTLYVVSSSKFVMSL